MSTPMGVLPSLFSHPRCSLSTVSPALPQSYKAVTHPIRQRTLLSRLMTSHESLELQSKRNGFSLAQCAGPLDTMRNAPLWTVVALLLLCLVTLTVSFCPAKLSTTPRGPPSRLLFFDFGGKKKADEAPPPKQQQTPPPQEDKDPVESIFEFFFGKIEAEPLGLKRFDSQRFPEQYPATIDEWADPLPGDALDVAKLRPLLKNTNMETRPLRLTYDANKDGWDALKFHQKVDKQGGALVVCTTRLGLVCGGYNPKGWVGYGEARGSIAAFLFQQQPNGRFIKLRKVGGAGMAQVDNPENGPSFGADSLVIPLGKDNPRLARSKLGSYYERFSDGGNSLFNKDASVQLRDLKVYHGVYEEGEYVPFTDAEPFALY